MSDRERRQEVNESVTLVIADLEEREVWLTAFNALTKTGHSVEWAGTKADDAVKSFRVRLIKKETS